MIGEYLINPTQSFYSINNLSREYLGYYGVDEEALLGKGKNKRTFDKLSKEEIGSYISFILDTVFKVEDKMKKILEDYEMLNLYYNVELPLVEVLASMEFYGFKIDKEELEVLGKEYDEEIKTLTSEIYELAGGELILIHPSNWEKYYSIN